MRTELLIAPPREVIPEDVTGVADGVKNLTIPTSFVRMTIPGQLAVDATNKSRRISFSTELSSRDP